MAAARPAGLSPPALVTILTPCSSARSRRVLELAEEGARVPAAGVLHPVAAEDEHGQLGEVVAGQVVERPAGEHLAHGGEPVPVEPGRSCRSELVILGSPSLGPCRAARRTPARWPATASASVADRHQRRVRAVHPLGHQQAELQRRPGHPLRRVLRAPRPQLAVRAASARPGTAPPARQAPDQVREVPGPHADVSHVPQPGRRGSPHAQRVRHVLAVCPRLHQPRGRHRRRATSAGRTTAASRPAAGRAAWPPASPGPRATTTAGPAGSPAVRPPRPRRVQARRPADELRELRRNSSGAVRREQRTLVRPRQMRDLVRHRPTHRRRRARPPVRGQVPDQRVDLVTLRTQVGHESVQLHHAPTMARETQSSKHACFSHPAHLRELGHVTAVDRLGGAASR